MESLPHYPATARNRQAILEVISPWCPQEQTLLEVASGTGEHAAWMAPQQPGWRWIPSDADPSMLSVIDSYNQHNSNVHSALLLNTEQGWSSHPELPDQLSTILCVNMIHIAPWAAATGLFEGAEQVLQEDGALILYGPFKENGQHISESNHQFDLGLRARDHRWGVRDISDVSTLAAACSFELVATAPMPANNRTLLFRRKVP